jgi:4a-hydroxytetrahydrobiopterin dehydratase
VPPLKALLAKKLLRELGQGWKLNGRGHLVRLYTFKDFAQSLAFANKVGAVAEAEGHHPICTCYHASRGVALNS